MKNIHRDGADISYRLSGNGDITLLFVHGSYTDQSWWKSQVDFFHNDYKVVTVDLPGHGQSGTGRKNWSIAGFANDVSAVIEALNLTNIILIGHSLGAAVSLMVATSNPTPLLGIIAIEYFKNAGSPLPDNYRQQSQEIQQKLKTDFRNTNEQYARMTLLSETTGPGVSKRVVEAYRNAFQPMGIATTPEIFDIYKTEQTLLPQLAFKLYLINVNYMPTSEPALQKYTGSGYQLFTMDGTSHFPMLENPFVLNQLLYRAVQDIAVNALHGA